MVSYRGMFIPIALIALMASACQSNGEGEGEPAALAAADAETMARAKAALAEAMGVAKVELGPGDPTKMSTLAVLPPRPTAHEDRSLARPTVFDIVLKDGRCFAVRRETGEAYELKDVSCRALRE
ncbi:hypothetical protein [Amphiplicatus metriothermophilus]|uniref:Lipoprotein n=1 Tax=Amphiplicatus metriothermophilus TaxID=1519374 RepID=A0A239PTA0_9PROT|nr:hypothetical protein [Amphiplicatus metriothermophilus]MBB5519387.1 hypothetical protein [Amphiplicatus metriothermophilus]SNT73519.1 hypothetical protein SAMN06297382_1856 [Amphiplicatus metriothermophilus]